MNEQELLPCPFCGSGKVEIRGFDNDTSCDCACTSCRARSGRFADTWSAVDAWNRRAPRLAAQPLTSAEEALREIGDFAHDRSTGPAVPDALWEVREMAYAALRSAQQNSGASPSDGSVCEGACRVEGESPPASPKYPNHPDGRADVALIGWPKNRERFYLDIIYPGTREISAEYDYRPIYAPLDEHDYGPIYGPPPITLIDTREAAAQPVAQPPNAQQVAHGDALICGNVPSCGATQPSFTGDADVQCSKCGHPMQITSGAQQVAQTGVPEGWKLVPIEPTISMLVSGFESEPDEFFSSPAEWAVYDAMSGCAQGHHRARLCWAAMLAASPAPTKQATEWQPIETAPKDGTRILAVCMKTAERTIRRMGHMAVTEWDDTWGEFNHISWPATHWMPLPAPPLAAAPTPEVKP